MARLTEMPETHDCVALRDLLDRLGDRWSLYIILTLKDRPKRFSELKREVEGISQRMLSLVLRALERDGFIVHNSHRHGFADYELTPLGLSLIQPVNTLWAWAINTRNEVLNARKRFDNVAEDQPTESAK
ncbi:helix-turn-helix domain-containing protein [Asticcacaulis sp. ZE23SCel15]|uniref:winged helix-turn-helix transcriptional regulator n=1 Tax=Asticcacaulis sp. ZE23SCel15 TaxID=3059027 RepID=UPI0026603FD1|nr:helix-turn-helix domain-containing protein [Asticcacaulis sp. ZE23SCel15]WKL56510.1 helix-turn-helix domain-containing protein [Asticcacaulis sp. ZE23SCel15]